MNSKATKLESIQISVPENIESEKAIFDKIPKNHNAYKGQLQKARASFDGISKNSSRPKERSDFGKQAKAIDSILQNGNALSQLYQKVMLSRLNNHKLETDYAEFANQYLHENNSQKYLEQLIKQLGGKKVKQQFSPPDAIDGSSSNPQTKNVFNENLNILELIIIESVKGFKLQLEQRGIKYLHFVGSLDTTKPESSQDLSRLPYHLITLQLADDEHYGVMTNFGKASYIYFLKSQTSSDIKKASILTKKELIDSGYEYAQVSISDLENNLEFLLENQQGISWLSKLNCDQLEEFHMKAKSNMSSEFQESIQPNLHKEPNKRKTEVEIIEIVRKALIEVLEANKKLKQHHEAYRIVNSFIKGSQHLFLNDVEGLKENMKLVRKIWSEQGKERKTQVEIIRETAEVLKNILETSQKLKSNHKLYKTLNEYYRGSQYQFLGDNESLKEDLKLVKIIWVNQTKPAKSNFEIIEIARNAIVEILETKNRLNKNNSAYGIIQQFIGGYSYKFLGDNESLKEGLKLVREIYNKQN